MKKIKTNIYLLYTLSFLVLLLVALLPQQLSSNTLFSFGFFTDGLKQHLVFMYDYVRVIKEGIKSGNFSAFRYDIGLGADFFVSYSFYSLFDPLTLIAYLIPLKYIEFSYYLIAILRLYLAGIFIILLAKRFKIKKVSSLLAVSLFYVFNSSILFTAFRHPMFINGPMLLPLVILGTEKVFNKESSWLLILASFLGLITQFYFFIYTSFAFELYIIIRLLFNREKGQFKKTIKGFISINLLYCLGVFIGGFVLIPQLLATINSARVASKGFILYDAFDLMAFQTSFIIPVIGKHYTSSLGNGIALFLCFVYIFKNKKNYLSLYFVILCSLIFISLFGYAINVFSYVNNRWTYIINVPAALMVGSVLEDYEKIDFKVKNKGIKAILSVIISILSFAIIYFISKLNILFITILSYVLFIFFAGYLLKKLWESNLTLIKHFKWQRILTLQLSFCFIVLLGMSLYYHFYENTPYGLSSYISNDLLEEINDDQEFFRVDQNTYALNTTFYGNDNLYSGFKAPYVYNSMSSKDIINLLDYLEVTNNNLTAGYNGFNNRLRLNILNQVKYLIVRESELVQVPFGYELVDTITVKKAIPKPKSSILGTLEKENNDFVYEKAYIYCNQNFLNFGNMFYEYTTFDDLKDVNPVDRENVMFKTIVLEEERTNIKKLDNLPRIHANAITNYQVNNLEINGNTIIVNQNGGTINFTIDKVEDEEVFVEIVGLKSEDKMQSFNTIYQTKDAVVQEKNYGYGTNGYTDNSHHLVNLGFYNEENLGVSIFLPQGKYTFEKLSYYLNPINDIIITVNELNKSTLTNLEFNNRGFSGDIEAINDGVLYISIPYSPGFTAYVDGIKQPIQKVNMAYMGLYLTEGTHHIEFRYQTPGLKLGFIVSIAAILTMIIMLIIKKRMREKQTNESNQKVF